MPESNDFFIAEPGQVNDKLLRVTSPSSSVRMVVTKTMKHDAIAVNLDVGPHRFCGVRRIEGRRFYCEDEGVFFDAAPA